MYAHTTKSDTDDDDSSVTFNLTAHWVESRFTMWQLDYGENHFTSWADWDRNHSEHQSEPCLSFADWDMNHSEHHRER